MYQDAFAANKTPKNLRLITTCKFKFSKGFQVFTQLGNGSQKRLWDSKHSISSDGAPVMVLWQAELKKLAQDLFISSLLKCQRTFYEFCMLT